MTQASTTSAAVPGSRAPHEARLTCAAALRPSHTAADSAGPRANPRPVARLLPVGEQQYEDCRRTTSSMATWRVP
jgi:hypothetical protein